MQAGSSLRPGGRAIALIVVWLVAVVIVAATSQVRAGSAPSTTTDAPVAAIQPVTAHVARADTEESPSLTLAIAAVLAAAALSVATLRRGVGVPVRARRLVPVAQRVVVRRS